MAATGTPTPNIGLRIPNGTDPASVDDINYNSNLLDTKLGAVGNTSVQDQIDSLNSKMNIVQQIVKRYSEVKTHTIENFGNYNIAIVAVYVEGIGTSCFSLQTSGTSVNISHLAGAQTATESISATNSNGTLTITTTATKFTMSLFLASRG